MNVRSDGRIGERSSRLCVGNIILWGTSGGPAHWTAQAQTGDVACPRHRVLSLFFPGLLLAPPSSVTVLFPEWSFRAREASHLGEQELSNLMLPKCSVSGVLVLGDFRLRCLCSGTDSKLNVPQARSQGSIWASAVECVEHMPSKGALYSPSLPIVRALFIPDSVDLCRLGALGEGSGWSAPPVCFLMVLSAGSSVRTVDVRSIRSILLKPLSDFPA